MTSQLTHKIARCLFILFMIGYDIKHYHHQQDCNRSLQSQKYDEETHTNIDDPLLGLREEPSLIRTPPLTPTPPCSPGSKQAHPKVEFNLVTDDKTYFIQRTYMSLMKKSWTRLNPRFQKLLICAAYIVVLSIALGIFYASSPN